MLKGRRPGHCRVVLEVVVQLMMRDMMLNGLAPLQLELKILGLFFECDLLLLKFSGELLLLPF